MADPQKILEMVVKAYIEAFYFTDTGSDADIDKLALLAQESYFGAVETCSDFLKQAASLGLLEDYTDTGATWESFGHDLWLTRNSHGAGFWDRGHGKLGLDLSKLAKALGSASAFEDNDGLIYWN